jgi:hypothetical protein
MTSSNPLWTILRLVLVVVSLAFFAAGLAQDALSFESRVFSGADALREGVLGLAVLSLAGLVWVANVALWASWLTILAGRSVRWSAWLTALSTVLGLLIISLFFVEQPIHGPFAPGERLVGMGPGAYYWLASIGCALAATLVLLLERRATARAATG